MLPEVCIGGMEHGTNAYDHGGDDFGSLQGRKGHSIVDEEKIKKEKLVSDRGSLDKPIV